MRSSRYPDLGSDPVVQGTLLFLFAAAVFFAKLGLNGMAGYDDCFYAQEAKEILARGNWSVLYFYGDTAFHNTPLFMWLVALSYKVFGIGVFAAKFPSALLGFLTVFLVYFLGRALWDPRAGFLAGFILATTIPFTKYGRHAMLDVPLTFFVTLSMAGLILALRKDRRFFWLWGLGIALAFLTKSVFGFFPAIGTVLYLGATKRWKEFWGIHFIGATILFLFTTLTWGLFEYHIGGQKFIHTHLEFIIMGKVFGETPEPWYAHLSFLKEFASFYWPWLPLAVWGCLLLLRGDWKDKEGSIFLLIWAFLVPVVMSLMHTRYLWYLMQSFPAWALISSYGLLRLFPSEEARSKLVKNLAFAGLIASVLINVLPISVDRDREKDVRILAPYVKHFAQKGAKITRFREYFWDINNAMLFFSDHAADPLYDDVGSLKQGFSAKETVLCVVHRGDLPEIQAAAIKFYPVKYAEDRILIANQQLELSDVKTWGGLWEK